MILVAHHKYDKAAIDPWSAVSFGSGLASGLTDMSLGRALAILALSDFVFAAIGGKRGMFSSLEAEPLENKVMDVLFYAYGNSLGRKWAEMP